MLNFTWWVNRKDAEGRNVFQGGFLGLDNIGVFDRSAPLPTGGYINQSDGTSWMAMYSLNLMRIALELAQHNHVYEDIATKFFEHFLHIAEAMTKVGDGMGLSRDGKPRRPRTGMRSRPLKIQMPRNIPMAHTEHSLDEPGDTGRRLQMTQIGLHRTQHQRRRTIPLAENT